MHQPALLLLQLWFYCRGDWVRWVSVWKSRSLCWRRENEFDFVVKIWNEKTLFSLKKNEGKDFYDSQKLFNSNGNKTGEGTLYTFVSSSLKKIMCKDFSSMSEDSNYFNTMIFHRTVFKKRKNRKIWVSENMKMTKKDWRSSSFSKWTFQLLFVGKKLNLFIVEIHFSYNFLFWNASFHC